MHLPQSFVFPDCTALLRGWRAAQNPHLECVRATSHAWIFSYCTFSKKDKASFIKHDFPSLAAWFMPDCSAERLRTLSDETCQAFVWDDLLDDGILTHDVDAAQALHDQVVELLSLRPEEMQDYEPKRDVLKALKDYFLRFCVDTNELTQRRYAACVIEYSEATTRLLKERVTGEGAAVRTVESHILDRRLTGGPMPPIVFIEYCYGLHIPDHLWNHESLIEIRNMASDLICGLNDLFSFNKEQAVGQTDNIVWLYLVQGLSLQGAIDACTALVTDQVDRFLAAEQRVPQSDDPRVAADVSRWIAACKELVAGVVEWYYRSGRYFFDDNKDARRTGLVKVLPRRVEAPVNVAALAQSAEKEEKLEKEYYQDVYSCDSRSSSSSARPEHAAVPVCSGCQIV